MDIKLRFLLACSVFCQALYANNVLYDEGKILCDKILADLKHLEESGEADEDEIEQAKVFISRLKLRFQRPQSYVPLKKDLDISHIDADDVIDRAENLPKIPASVKKQSIDSLINEMHTKYSKEE